MNIVTIDNDFRTKKNQRVVAAANRCTVLTDKNPEGTKVIFAGARHFDVVMRSQMDAVDGEIVSSSMEEGFIDQYGNFLSREEALAVVVVNGQRFDPSRNVSKDKLYSEGVW